jgi:hypothetical protein
MRSVVAALALAGVASCDSTTGIGPASEVQALAAAAKKWEAIAPPSYAFTLLKSCFCPYEGPVRVTVRNGVIESVQVLGTGAYIPDDRLDWFSTIPDVFAALAYALDLPAASYSARFDPTWGFPVEASIDHWIDTADDEIGYRLSDFVALP